MGVTDQRKRIYSDSDSEVAQPCPTLCDPMDSNLPGSVVHGIFQARKLEWAAISFFRGSSQPRDWTRVSHIAGRCFTIWATREYPSPPRILPYQQRMQEDHFIQSTSIHEMLDLHKSWPAGGRETILFKESDFLKSYRKHFFPLRELEHFYSLKRLGTKSGRFMA